MSTRGKWKIEVKLPKSFFDAANMKIIINIVLPLKANGKA